MKARDQRVSIVVAGAGPVGLLFALRLLSKPLDCPLEVRIVDANAPAIWREDQLDPRVYALSRESQQQLGPAWQTILAKRASSYRRMRVWEGENAAGSASIGFDAADIGEPDLGHIVEDNLLRTALLDQLSELDVELSFDLGIESLHLRNTAVSVEFTDGSSCEADLVVGADGAASRVRAAAGIESLEKPYGQQAIVAHVTTEFGHRQTAFQRFLDQGPLALLPLADGRSSIVWTNSDAAASALLAADEQSFLAALQQASGNVLGKIRSCSKRYSFALKCAHAARYAKRGIALIGDAAHSVHPLAGQGMNLGMRDAVVLADTVRRAVAEREYPGDERVLKRYERAQKAHNLAMQFAFDGINEIFSRPVPKMAATLRGIGFAMVDQLAPVKQLLMRRALGLDRA